MPIGSPCTSLITPGDKAEGLGAYYDPTCLDHGGVGCDYQKPVCRLCAKNPALIDKPYVKCPACV